MCLLATIPREVFNICIVRDVHTYGAASKACFDFSNIHVHKPYDRSKTLIDPIPYWLEHQTELFFAAPEEEASYLLLRDRMTICMRVISSTLRSCPDLTGQYIAQSATYVRYQLRRKCSSLISNSKLSAALPRPVTSSVGSTVKARQLRASDMDFVSRHYIYPKSS